MIYPKKWWFSRATLVYQRVSTKQLVPLWNLSHAFATLFETHRRFIFRTISLAGEMQTLSTVPGLEQVLCWADEFHLLGLQQVQSRSALRLSTKINLEYAQYPSKPWEWHLSSGLCRGVVQGLFTSLARRTHPGAHPGTSKSSPNRSPSWPVERIRTQSEPGRGPWFWVFNWFNDIRYLMSFISTSEMGS
jgi:hypothetical protein